MEDSFHRKVRIPKGIDISEPVCYIGSERETCCTTNDRCKSQKADIQDYWGYLFVHRRRMAEVTERLDKDGIRYFIHKSVTYRRNRLSRAVTAIERPSVNGLIFLKGTTRILQDYLDNNLPGYHLVKDCSTHLPAVIKDSVMQPFMRISKISPERIRFLLQPFRYYAGGNVRLRITSGFLAGLEGYIIRIDRDRRLVMDVGGMSVAVSGIHCEKFEIVEERKNGCFKKKRQEGTGIDTECMLDTI